MIFDLNKIKAKKEEVKEVKKEIKEEVKTIDYISNLIYESDLDGYFYNRVNSIKSMYSCFDELINRDKVQFLIRLRIEEEFDNIIDLSIKLRSAINSGKNLPSFQNRNNQSDIDYMSLSSEIVFSFYSSRLNSKNSKIESSSIAQVLVSKDPDFSISNENRYYKL